MQVAGAEVLVYEIIQRLGSRIVPFVYCLDAVGPIGERLIASGVKVVAFNRQPGLDWRLFGRMADAIRTDKIDVVHAHQYTPFFYSSIAARRSGTRPRVVFTEHGRHYPDIVSWKRRWTNRLVLDRLADEVTAVCEFSANALANVDGFARDRIRIIPNGIDLHRYEAVADRTALRRRLGLDPDRRYISIVARFHPVKDHSTLLKAFALVARVVPDADLLLVGDGPLRPDIEHTIETLGLGGRVRLVGVQSNVPEWLLASDVFVLSSVSEAASITLLEAMACGLPVVVTDVGGNPELVRRGEDGLLVPRGDPTAMSTALLTLLDDGELRARMGRSGTERVRQHFLTATTVERYADVYEALRRAT